MKRFGMEVQMSHPIYSEQKLFELGKENYDKLVLYCETLEVTGFWSQARQVMRKSSMEVLDLYVQSVLMNLAVHCGKLLDSQQNFIRTLTDTNPLEIPESGEVDEEIYQDSKRLYELPPVLLQLCGLYDAEKSQDMTEYFLDAFLNLLLCMAYLNDGKDIHVNEFIRKYYDKIVQFVANRDEEESEIYIVRKLESDEICCEVEWLHERKKEKVLLQTQFQLGTAIAKEESVVTDEIYIKDELVGRDEFVTEEAVTEQITTEEEKRLKAKEQEKLAKEFAKARERQEELDRQEKEREERLRKEEEKLAREQFLRVKKRIQERERAEKEAREARIKELMDELNALVGLREVKEEIQSLINLIKIRQLREQMNMPTMEMSYHMVFMGSPGTGKTTVARLVGKIYKELGILSDGKMIETDRSGLVAGYVGQTAMKVHDIVKEAVGGVLFIDEAYSLVNPDVPNDFGGEAVDTLVKLMEDHRDNLVIIVAGYTDEMKRFLKSNTGLISRFNKFIDFPDYTKQELIEIMEAMAQNAGLDILEETKEKIAQVLEKMTEAEWEDFGNARGIRNLFEKIVTQQANRLVSLPEPTKEDLMRILPEDVLSL